MKYIMGMSSVFMFSVAAHAALKAPDFTVSTAQERGKTSVSASAPAGHHFNTDAPMSLELESNHTRLKPKKSAPTQVDFEVPSASKDSAKIALYMCDDAKTFCEKHQVNVNWEGQAPAGTESKASHGATDVGTSTKTSSAKETTKKSKLDHHGFYDNLPEEAFALARTTGKPLMIDFYGIWCPPCNELNDHVLSKGAFKKQAGAFVKLKMDADASASEALSQRYGIQGFPTVIFASPEGDEISRIVGFRPLDQVLAEMKSVLNNKSVTFAALKSRADKNDRAAMDRVGLIYLDRGEYDSAYRYLKDTKAEKEKLRASEIGLYEKDAKSGNEDAKAKWLSALQRAIDEFPDSPDSILRREDLAGALNESKKTDEAKKIRQELIAAAARLISKPQLLKGYDSSPADLYVAMAETYSELGNQSEANTAWSSAAAIYKKKIEAGAERGGTLELAYCLRKLGKTDEASKLYQKMEKAYPKEFTFWLADAKMNMQLKNFDKARELAQSAFDNSYGANKLDSAVVLANAWKQLGKPDQGKKVIAQALEAVPPLPPAANPAARSRIRSRIEGLNKLTAELNQHPS
jgi:thioredoxin-like negative regulator of GroEL